ncbi:hypothetical protein P692DRAFT_20920529 [Suillus brevipes Sb2]|nr:hypothetical protein P692DRAFT_20920529 [Suillus brevipes Sb2]
MVSALAFHSRANLSLTQNPNVVLGLYTDRLGQIRTKEKAATEWTFRSMEIQCRKEVVQVFCRCVSHLHPRVCRTASTQDVQSKRPFATCTLTPWRHGPTTYFVNQHFYVSPLAQFDFAILVLVFSFHISVERQLDSSYYSLRFLVLNVLQEFFVSLLAYSRSGHNDYDFRG